MSVLQRCLGAAFMLFVPIPAGAMTLEVCNAGRDMFYIAHSEGALGTGRYNIGGWSSLEAGKCWNRRTDPSIYEFNLLVAYIDAQGRMGVAQHEQSVSANRSIGPGAYQKTPRSHCIDPVNQFSRPMARQNEGECPDQMVLVKFTTIGHGLDSNTATRLDVTVDHAMLHEDWNIIPLPQLKTEPKHKMPERYVDVGEANRLIRPTALQIEAAEYENLRIRMAFANALILRRATIEITDLVVDKCVSVEEGDFYCRYRLDAHVEAPPEIEPMAKLLMLGFSLKGYYWSNFELRDGRWKIVRQWDGCRLSETDIYCWGEK